MSAEGAQTSVSSNIVLRQSYSPIGLRLQRGAAWTGLVMLLLVFFLFIGKLTGFILIPMRTVSAWAYLQMRTWGLHFINLYTVDKPRWNR